MMSAAAATGESAGMADGGRRMAEGVRFAARRRDAGFFRARAGFFVGGRLAAGFRFFAFDFDLLVTHHPSLITFMRG